MLIVILSNRVLVYVINEKCWQSSFFSIICNRFWCVFYFGLPRLNCKSRSVIENLQAYISTVHVKNKSASQTSLCQDSQIITNFSKNIRVKYLYSKNFRNVPRFWHSFFGTFPICSKMSNLGHCWRMPGHTKLYISISGNILRVFQHYFRCSGPFSAIFKPFSTVFSQILAEN